MDRSVATLISLIYPIPFHLKELCGEEMVADVASSEGEPPAGLPLLSLLLANLTVLHHLYRYNSDQLNVSCSPLGFLSSACSWLISLYSTTYI